MAHAALIGMDYGHGPIRSVPRISIDTVVDRVSIGVVVERGFAPLRKPVCGIIVAELRSDGTPVRAKEPVTPLRRPAKSLE